MVNRYSLVGLVMASVVAACASNESPGAPIDTARAAGVGEADPGAADPAAEPSLSRPLGCSGEGVVSEPMPGKEIYEALRLEAGVDFIERRAIEDTGSWPSLSVGTPCSGASDSSACTTALASLTSTEVLLPFDLDTFASGPKGFYLVYSKGNTVGKISNAAELRALVPTVDAPAVALMYAEAAAYRVECTTNWVREDADGFVVLSSNGPACRRNRILLFVGRDGTIEERKKTPGDSACL